MQGFVRSVPLVVSLSLLAADAAAQPLAFARTTHVSAIGARAIVSADFNRDGWPDVAHANLDTNSVSILLSDEGARLRPRLDTAVGTGPFDLAAGDVNQDGIPDLVVANADSHAISLLLGLGNGRFTRRDLSTGSRRGPRGVALGDVDNDGNADLVYTAYDSAALVILRGDGNGGFAPAWDLASAARPQGVAIGDFDRDGHADIATAHNAAAGLTIWSGSAGAFTPATVPGASSLNVLAVADLDADGWSDVAAASTSGGRVALYFGDPAGLTYRRSYAVEGDPRGIAVADVDINGALDVITASRGTSTVSVLPGDPAHRGSFLARRSFAAGRGSRAVAVADFDHDGRLDLATGNQYSTTTSILRNTTPFLRAAYSFDRLTLPAGANLARYRASLTAGRGLAAADFNRDGRIDFAQRVAGADAVAVVLTGTGTVVLSGTATYGGHVVDDFNADGNADVLYFAVTAAGGSRLVTYAGDGRGAFTPSPATLVPEVRLAACAAGDMNGDGRPDLACVEQPRPGEGEEPDFRNGALQVLPGNGDGTFRLSPAPGGQGMDPHLGDVNRDGRLDVVLAGTGQIWIGDGHGGLTPGQNLAVPGEVNPGWRVALADLNHDAYEDLVFTYNGESLFLSFGGAAGFGPLGGSFFNCECDFTFAVGDINVDGHPDILINSVEGTELAGRLFVWPGHGDGTFGSPEDFHGDTFAFAPGEILVTDVTRDGLPDVVAAGAHQIDVLVNERGETNHPPAIVSRDLGFAMDYVTLRDQHDGCITFPLDAPVDPDQHAVSIAWNIRGPEFAQPYASPQEWVGDATSAMACFDGPGRYDLRLVAADGRGAVVERSLATVSLSGPEEIVLHMTSAFGRGAWSILSDASAASGVRAYDPNLKAPRVAAPSPDAAFIALTFVADPERAYKLWFRMKADGDNWASDSVWVQFAWSADAAGNPAFQWGTASGLMVSLEECVNCGVKGWGWTDDGWGAVGRNGVLVRFPKGGRSEILIQTREDGVSIDQIVLSAERYRTTPPGAAKSDRTILPPTQP